MNLGDKGMFDINEISNSFLEGYGDVLTSAEVKEILKVGKTTLYGLLSDKKIRSIRIGKEYRILKSDLLLYLKTLKQKQ